MAKQWKPAPSRPSPETWTGIVGWLRINLFSSPANTLLTILGAGLLLAIIPPMVRWGVFDAVWLGDSRAVCDSSAAAGNGGACWVFVKVRLDMFLYGFYPEPERWRIDLMFTVLGFSLIPLLAPDFFRTGRSQALVGGCGVAVVFLLFGALPAVFMIGYTFAPFLFERVSLWHTPQQIQAGKRSAAATGAIGVFAVVAAVYWSVRLAGVETAALPVSLSAGVLSLCLLFFGRLGLLVWRWIFLFCVFSVFAFFMLVGGILGLPEVETHYWGGLFLTLVVAGTGMGTALPVSILLALGRRSELPVVKTLCVSFIEFVRGVPLVSVLFMASVMFPLFLPENVTFDKLLRALIGVAFFYAAYMAEVIRGGLQAIPKGQYEAAKALGWTYWKMMGLIIMPQTLRLVIPGLANNFLSLLKDTTLVAVIGLLDLLGIAKAAMADSEWLGFTKEAYVFAGVVFWIFCFGISRYSVRLEKKYHTNYQ
ncbi:amino acid ABC transporter permease [Desulforhopalus singaporensis]|uniref:Amino acid ABC transporter membrane protein 2, PAAT family n=1 Tax=Desulforhopalus singaporensis TaxID=91360 RepID=A0A1H0RWC6_9BACT|nr:amino acid ABC transporter permease [Desulforhopalus singaporensis]SDP33705.1 amino acid ABC transporter membrane protein 2, PAAT family [Desulforhopalus singaporensis]